MEKSQITAEEAQALLQRPGLAEFAGSLGIPAEGEPLLRQALTHRSMSDIAPIGDNERLEFLGDSILGMLVNEHLYTTYPDLSEGELTKMKVRVISKPCLARAAATLGVGDLLAMVPGEEAAGGRTRPSTLADAFEAVLAALYLSRGLDACRRFVLERLLPYAEEEMWDSKSRLQELMQERHRVTPRYEIREATGPAHAREFVSEVLINDEVAGRGTGPSKKAAEQAAAAAALEMLEATGAIRPAAK